MSNKFDHDGDLSLHYYPLTFSMVKININHSNKNRNFSINAFPNWVFHIHYTNNYSTLKVTIQEL